VTADSNGNFSLELTDSRADPFVSGTSDVEPETYSIYAVANGEVAGTTGNTAASIVPTANDSNVYFGNSTSLVTLSLGAFDSYVQSNSTTTLTGVSAEADNGVGKSLTTTSGTINNVDNGSNAMIADVYVEPQNSAGHNGPLVNSALTYTLSASNGGLIYSINGVNLATPAGAVTVSYTPPVYNSLGAVITPAYFTANGVTIPILSSPAGSGSGLAVNTQGNYEDFEVGVINSNPGASTLTVASGNVTSTATINFNGGQPAQVASLTPTSQLITPGSSQQISFQVQDANGNPVAANTAVQIYTDALDSSGSADPLFVTAVNGSTLQEPLNLQTEGSTNQSVSTVTTPIPLGLLTVAGSVYEPVGFSSGGTSLNYSVAIPGVASWTPNAGYFTAYTGASGNITLTLQAGGLTYPTAYSTVGSTVYGNLSSNVSIPSDGSVQFWTNTNGAAPYSLYIGTKSTGAPLTLMSNAGGTASEVGTLQW
jgi:hypothetical protein